MDETQPPRWMRRAQARGRRRANSRTMTASALAALFAATACSPASTGVRAEGGGTTTSTSTPAETGESTTTTAATDGSTTTSSSTTTTRAGGRSTTTSPTTTSSTTSSTAPPTTSTTRSYPYCETQPDGSQVCAIDGRPLRRKRRRGWLLPNEALGGDEDALGEYASVASFGELALRLIGLGAPVELVEACHRAALDEIRHARTADALAARDRSRFGAIPGVLGRRIGGGWFGRRSRDAELRAVAVESFVDGWLNEGAAAARLRERALAAATAEERAALSAMADDEQRHADLGRQIVEWCFSESPDAVGPALAAVA